jgi:hypothetical protein
MPSYEIVIDTCDQWDAFPALKQGFRRILAEELAAAGLTDVTVLAAVG